MTRSTQKISAETVRADFNDLVAVLHYTRAAHEIGLWQSERLMIERFLPDRQARVLEAGCGAGRVTLGLWQLGFRDVTAFDFAEELLDQARSLALEQKAERIRFLHADATNLAAQSESLTPPFGAALFMFNGLMQIPGRESRRAALREIHRLCAPGAPFLFTTHDRNSSPIERARWREESIRWQTGGQDPRLIEFGDRYFEDETGRTFMHLPDRDEILADLAATGWVHDYDEMRLKLAREARAVLTFSDDCRFWVARRG